MREPTSLSESARFRSAVTRRQLLQRAGYTVAGLTLAGTALADAQTPKFVLGEGDHKYECIHDWLTPPDSINGAILMVEWIPFGRVMLLRKMRA